MSGPYSAWLKLLLLCGQRRVETASMRRSQIIDGSWHLSATDTKNKQPHIIPLPNQAQRLVDQLIEKEGNFLIKSWAKRRPPSQWIFKSKATDGSLIWRRELEVSRPKENGCHKPHKARNRPVNTTKNH